MHFETALTPSFGNSTFTESHRRTVSNSFNAAYSLACESCSKETAKDTAGAPSLLSVMYLFASSLISSSDGYWSSHSYEFSHSFDRSSG